MKGDVSQVAMGSLICGIVLAVLTEVLWRLIPLDRSTELAVSCFSGLGWLLTSATVAIASTCPVDELDFNQFVQLRPVLCLFLAVLPLTTAVTRVWEMPFPRWTSCGVSVLMLANAGLYYLPSCTRLRPYAASFGVLMEALLTKSRFNYGLYFT